MKGAIKTEHMVIGLIVIVAIMLIATGNIPFQAAPGGGEGGVTPPGYATNVKVSGFLPIEGTMALANAELWSSDNTQVVGETSVPGTLTSLTTTGPNSFSGFVMIGKIWM